MWRMAYFKDNSISNSLVGIHRDFKVFPNPSSNVIFIDNKNRETIFIYNSKGEITSNNDSIDISNLPTGSYFIKMSDRKSQFIKQ